MLSVVVLSGFGRFFRIYQKIRQLKIAKKNLVEFDFKISLIVARDQKLKHKRLKQSCRGQWLNS
jgi:hypothetical protein